MSNALDEQQLPDAGDPSPFVNALDVDSNNDVDSAIGVGLSPSTASLRSSVYDYVEENGRRYHRFKEGKYILPNDEAEQDRLDLQHHLFRMTFDDKLYLAPLEHLKGRIHNALDIATGTGIWAIEFATEFPSANVIGTDLSPIQPEFVPPNCHFEVDDSEDDWQYSHSFDYVHARMIAACFKSHFNVFRSAFETLRPGGYLEIQDTSPFECIDDSENGSAFQRWKNLSIAGVKKLGMQFDRAPQYKSYLEEIGYADVVQHRFAWPIGPWARGEKMKTIGMWAQEDFLQGMQGWTVAALTRGLGMAHEDVEVLLADVKQEIYSGRLHVYMPIWVVYGKKPS